MSYSDIYKSIGLNTEISRLRKQAYIGWNKEVKMLKNLGLEDGMRILEVGSGPGFVTELLLREFQNSIVTSLDMDNDLMEIARNRLEGTFKNRLNFVNESILNTSFKDNTFDFVLVRFVYQHINNPLKATKEIYRVLKPGGKVVIVDIDNGIWGVTNPELKLIPYLNNSLARFQNNSGGDRNIGRKLIKILKYSGFKNLDFQIVVKHSDLIGMDKFKDLSSIKNMQNTIFSKNPEISRIISSYNKFYNLESSTIIMLVIMAYGEKNI